MELDGADRTEMALTGLGTAQAAAYSAQLIGRENEVPMVSMDGEAHPNMTLAAIGLGVFVALIILLTLIAFITRRERSSHTKVAQQHSGPVHPNATAVPSIIPTISQKVTEARCTVSFANELELTDVVTRM
ncbi:uncharacterized protein LOC131291044 [Anopheles ziemanni]|uniref:uncharacterized protein LOC131269075 n=1 Tax=Anopheles coustani TaxID=139045 RepID=UPI00265B3D60|nr:uncharacterized protein LOC131269075 [Anopheles coustani]XP_058176216.1 uncharacterized protein LOC131291044 [Anopheles ziemanni]